MKKSLVLVSLMLVALLFVCSACVLDPAKSTQRDMLKYGEFYTDYKMGDEDVRFKLTLNKNHTFTLYIKDYESEVEEMKTFTGNWSHVLTYEYKYCSRLGTLDWLNKTRTATIGIYLLEGYTVNDCPNYFVYEKSTGKGGIHDTKLQITEEYLEQHRQACTGLANYKGPVELSMISMQADMD